MINKDVLSKLIELQERDKLTDDEMALKLGLKSKNSRVYWNGVKSGKFVLSDGMKFRAWQNYFAEMTPYFLPSNITKVVGDKVSDASRSG